MPSLIIIGYFATSKKVKAVIVNNFEYRYLDEPKKKDKSQERWLFMWSEGKKKCSSSLTIDSKTKKITKVNLKLNGGITGSILKQGQIILMKPTTFV